MKPFKGRVTEAVFRIVRFAPIFFPMWLRESSKDYSRDGSSISNYRRKEDDIKFGCFLEGDFIWKAIAITIQINHSDLERIHEWMRKEASPSDYNPQRDSDIFTTNYNQGGGYRSLGWLDINKEKSITSLASIQHEGDSCSSCYITLDKLSRGFSYITIYFMLSDEANQKVFNVNAESIVRYKCFQSLNPLSKRFKIIEHHDRYNGINRLIQGNFNKVVSDCKSISLSILKKWDIKKTNDDLIAIADFYRNNSSPYFYKRNAKLEKEKEQQKTHQALIDRFKSFYDINISDDDCENYCEMRFDDNLDVYAFYILSKLESEFEQHHDFSKIGLTTSDSHVFLALIHDCHRQFKNISKYANPALLENKNKAENNHNILYQALLKIDRLEENIQSISEHVAFSCEKKYQASVNSYLKNLKKIVLQFKESIIQRKQHSRDSLELRNLYFHRRYSYFVGILVVIQIVLAALTIDRKETINVTNADHENMLNKKQATENITNQSSRPPPASAD